MSSAGSRSISLGSPTAAGGLLGTSGVASFLPYYSDDVTQNPEQRTSEVQSKTVRTLKIPGFYSEYGEKGEGYATLLGSSIIAKVGPSTNHLSRSFLMMAVLRVCLFSKVTPRRSRNKSSVKEAGYWESGQSVTIGMSPVSL